ncbi:hypothetical protein EC991_005401 [Linnemannia zychae]|nr:hypothetical protein EC991_005401 [Linnemannia zychae]
MTTKRTFALRISIALFLVLGLVGSINAIPIPETSDQGTSEVGPPAPADAAAPADTAAPADAAAPADTAAPADAAPPADPAPADPAAGTVSPDQDTNAPSPVQDEATYTCYYNALKNFTPPEGLVTYTQACPAVGEPKAPWNDYDIQIISLLSCYAEAGDKWATEKFPDSPEQQEAFQKSDEFTQPYSALEVALEACP